MIDRCGVIAGPWQMDKVDQGAFTLSLIAHHFVRPFSRIDLRRQVKHIPSLLQVDHLAALLDEQLRPGALGRVAMNIGGDRVSLLETTRAMCRANRPTDRRRQPRVGSGRRSELCLGLPHLVQARRLAAA